jgi:hypothetical protein
MGMDHSFLRWASRKMKKGCAEHRTVNAERYLGIETGKKKEKTHWQKRL